MNNTHNGKVLALLIPTNRPQVFSEVFMQGAHHLAKAQDKILLSLNFQSPWTASEIEDTVQQLRNLGLSVVYRLGGYEIPNHGAIPFNKIRNDCLIELPTCIKYYGLCDDDCKFCDNSTEFLNAIIHRFENNEKLGLIQCTDILTKVQGMMMYEVNPHKHIFMTGDGFFFRKVVPDSIFPQDALENIGVGEENIIGLSLVEQGYTVEQCLYSAMKHYQNYKDMGNKDWYKQAVTCGTKGNITYIRNKYDSVYRV